MPHPYQPTPLMLQVLRWIDAGRDPVHYHNDSGRYGGRLRVLAALRERGYIGQRRAITAKGRDAIEKKGPVT